MVKCPRCGKEVSEASKEWDYTAFHVELFNCPKCRKSFKAYFHQGELSHTIPKTR